MHSGKTSGKYPRQERVHERVDGDKQTFFSLVMGNCSNVYAHVTAPHLASYWSRTSLFMIFGRTDVV